MNIKCDNEKPDPVLLCRLQMRASQNRDTDSNSKASTSRAALFSLDQHNNNVSEEASANNRSKATLSKKIKATPNRLKAKKSDRHHENKWQIGFLCCFFWRDRPPRKSNESKQESKMESCPVHV